MSERLQESYIIRTQILFTIFMIMRRYMQFMRMTEALQIECQRRAHRLPGKRNGIHGIVGVIQHHGIQRLRHQHQKRNALNIAQHIFRIDAARHQTIGIQRKCQPPDDAHHAVLRKHHRAQMINDHRCQRNDFQQTGIPVVKGSRRTEEGIF